MKKILFILLGVFLLGACSSSMSIYSDYDKSADFSVYKTYSFYDNPKAQYEQIVYRRVKEAIKKEMAAKGYTEVEKGDLTIVVDGRVEEKKETVVNRTGPSVGIGGYYSYYGWDSYDVREYRYDEGTLVISLVDTKKKQMVFEIVGKGEIDKKSTEEENINKIINQMFIKYPYKAGSNQRESLPTRYR